MQGSGPPGTGLRNTDIDHIIDYSINSNNGFQLLWAELWALTCAVDQRLHEVCLFYSVDHWLLKWENHRLAAAVLPQIAGGRL